MINNPIKIIKRKEAEAIAEAKIETKAAARHTVNPESERNSHRRIDATISSWIFERREKIRVEHPAALHAVFGNEILFGKT